MISQIGYKRKFLILYKYKSLLTLYMCFKIVRVDLDGKYLHITLVSLFSSFFSLSSHIFIKSYGLILNQ